MESVGIIAQVIEYTPTLTSSSVVPIDLIWKHVTGLSLIESLTFVSFGAICLFYGWRIYKILVMICFAMLGLFLGMIVNHKIGVPDNPLLAVLVAAVAASVSLPLLRWAICILGAAAGGLITAGVWYSVNLPEAYLWAGALTGIVAGGMVSFITYKHAVMLFSSLSGSGLIAAGCLALLNLYAQTSEQVQIAVFQQKWFLPVVIIVPTIIGLFAQNKLVNTAHEWEL